MNCKCCDKSVPEHRHGENALTEYCDAICFAAQQTLRPTALVFWRQHCELLRVNKHQARFDSVVAK